MSTGFDRLLGFTLPDRHARGRAVRLGPVLDESCSAHAYPPAIQRLAGRGAGAHRVARRVAQGCRRPADDAGAGREGRRASAAGVRLPRRRVARLCPVRRRAARRCSAPSRRWRRCSAEGRTWRSPSTLRDRPALPGHCAARRTLAGRGVRGLFRAVGAGADADPASAMHSDGRARDRGRPAGPASCRRRGRARAAACAAGPSGMGACRGARRVDAGTTSWSIRGCRSRRSSGGCSTRSARCGGEGRASAARLPLLGRALPAGAEPFSRRGSRAPCATRTAMIVVDCAFCSRLFAIALGRCLQRFVVILVQFAVNVGFGRAPSFGRGTEHFQ